MHPLAEAELLHALPKGKVTLTEGEKARVKRSLAKEEKERMPSVYGGTRWRKGTDMKEVREWENNWRRRLRGLEYEAYGRSFVSEW